MRPFIAIALTLAATAWADSPKHPDGLTYPPLDYRPPRPEDFRTTLSNGVVVFIAEDHELPTLDVQAIVRVGTHLDPEGKEGLASAVGDQMRNGGTEGMAPADLDGRLAFLAATIGSQVELAKGQVTLSCLSKDGDEALKLFADVLRRPRFDEARIGLYKTETLTKMKGRNDRTSGIEDREWDRLMYGSHPEARLATKASIEGLTRQELQDFHARHFTPRNVILSVAGDFKREEMLAKLEEAFRGWEARGETASSIPVPTSEPVPGVYMLPKPGVNQGRVSIGHLGIQRTNPDHYATTLLNYILGGGSFTSRITGRVRSDEGLAYSVNSRFQPGTYYPGTFRIAFQSKSETCAYAAKLCVEEMRKAIEGGVTEQELSGAKSYYVESFPNRFASKKDVVTTFADDELTGREKGYYERFRENVEKVTLDDVKRVAKEYLHPDKLVIVVVGDLDAIKKGDSAHPATFEELGPCAELPLPDPFTLQR
ncbi:MAG: pitrilysin family protein [Planctomycetota bacterium]